MSFGGGSRKVANVLEQIKDFGTNIPAATDRDGIGAAQQRTGSGALLVNGAATSGGAYSAGFDGGRLITIYSGGNLSARTFTVTGTDKDGAAQTENFTGPNNSTVTGTKYFQTVSAWSVDGTIASDAECGFSSSLCVLFGWRGSVFKLSPTNSEVVKIACYGAPPTGFAQAMTLHLTVPATLTLTFADGTTPTDSRIYFPAGAEPTPTASGLDILTFLNDGHTVSSDAVWFGNFLQDFKP